MKMLVGLVMLHLLATASSQEMETITGTVYCDNDFLLYVNGELVAEDPIKTGPHNAVNVSFSIQRGKDFVLAFEAIDYADAITGLEFDNRCLGSGGLRAMFSNGVVTNNSWVCSTQHYGPSNWKSCFAAQTVRNQSLQVLPGCMAESTPQLMGCVSRVTSRPDGWNQLQFDDSHWEYALEYTDDVVGWGLRPPNCEEPGVTVSSMVDPDGNPITCPENLDWGESSFIWRPDLSLDNTILCRYTVRMENSGSFLPAASIIVTAAAALLAGL